MIVLLRLKTEKCRSGTYSYVYQVQYEQILHTQQTLNRALFWVTNSLKKRENWRQFRGEL